MISLFKAPCVEGAAPIRMMLYEDPASQRLAPHCAYSNCIPRNDDHAALIEQRNLSEICMAAKLPLQPALIGK